MVTGIGKSFTVKEWYGNKVANEVKRNIGMCDVFCIIKETEKAIYAVMKLGCDFSKTMWVPKSVLIENEIGENEDFTVSHETFKADSYEEAMEAYKGYWEQYK